MNLTDPQKDTLKALVHAYGTPVAARDVYQLRMGRTLTEAEKKGAGSAQAMTLERLRRLGLVERVEGEGRRRESPGYMVTEDGKRLALRMLYTEDADPDPLPPVRERRSSWEGGRRRIRSEEEEKAVARAQWILSSVVVPGLHREPPASVELVDRDGTVWTTDKHSGRDGWVPEGGDDMALRWSSPALFAAGPFVLIPASRRSPRNS